MRSRAWVPSGTRDTKRWTEQKKAKQFSSKRTPEGFFLARLTWIFKKSTKPGMPEAHRFYWEPTPEQTAAWKDQDARGVAECIGCGKEQAKEKFHLADACGDCLCDSCGGIVVGPAAP
jgi:hypothetical protein